MSAALNKHRSALDINGDAIPPYVSFTNIQNYWSTEERQKIDMDR